MNPSIHGALVQCVVTAPRPKINEYTELYSTTKTNTLALRNSRTERSYDVFNSSHVVLNSRIAQLNACKALQKVRIQMSMAILHTYLMAGQSCTTQAN